MTTFEGEAMTSPTLPPRYPGVAHALARRLARRIVERRLQAEGAYISRMPITKVRELASEYLSAHPQLLDCAAEIVRTHPKLRMMAEVEERHRERQWRKLARAGRPLNPTGRSV